MSEQEQTQQPFAQVEVAFLQAIGTYIEQMPMVEVKQLSLGIDSHLENANGQFVQVNLGLLQALVDYLQNKPYKEVFQFVNISTGQNRPQVPQVPQVPDAPAPDANISEYVPEGFEVDQNTQEDEETKGE